MTKEEKKTLIDYMVKHCGLSEQSARKRFDKWVNDRIKTEPPKKKKRKLLSGKKMTREEIKSMVMYMYRHDFNTWWIAQSLGISDYEVSEIITKYRKL